MNLHKELEKYTKHYIESADVKDGIQLNYIRKLNEIILGKNFRKCEFKYTSRQDLKKSEKLAAEFLEQLNHCYKDYFDIRKIDGTIIYDKSKKIDCPYSDYDSEIDKRTIYIPVENNVSDVFAIVHELFHDINLDVDELSITRYAFTESLSILSELLLEDFLNGKGIKDYKINNDCIFSDIRYKALEVDFNLQLILSYLDNYYIDEQTLTNIFNKYNDKEIDYINLVLCEMLDNQELTIDTEQKYIIGIFIATYMYDRIKNNHKNINEVLELNEMIKKCTIDQVLDYLDLEYDNKGLTNQSYKILEKSYEKYLKSR